MTQALQGSDVAGQGIRGRGAIHHDYEGERN